MLVILLVVFFDMICFGFLFVLLMIIVLVELMIFVMRCGVYIWFLLVNVL